MAYPAGMTTAQMTAGPAIDIRETPVELRATITTALGGASHIVHADTGSVLVAGSPFSVVSGEDGTLAFRLPHVDQGGWVDPAGNAYKNWKYVVSITAKYVGGQSASWSKEIQPLVGQTGPIDVDLVPSGEAGAPQVADIPAVLSVDGKTGNVLVLPPGGAAGQVLAKATTNDYDMQWVNPPVGDGSVDLSMYATDQELADGLALKADRAELPDLSAYATDTDVTTALAPYATETYVDTAVSGVTVDLTGYATTAYADQAEADAVTTANTYTDQQISAIPAPDLTGYVTDTELTETLGGYTTDAELATALDGKSDDGHVHAITDVSGLDTALSGKANTTDVVLMVNGVTPDDAGNVTVSGGTGGVTDHGALTGLADDDHPQYALADGTREGINLAATHEFTAQQYFNAGSAATGVRTRHITVLPNAGWSASLFLDNEVGHVWEFFGNPLGEFGVYNKGKEIQPLTITDNAPHQSLVLNSEASFSVPVTAPSVNIGDPAPPATATSPGVAGDIRYDSTHIYVCVAANTWRRSALTAW